MIQLYDRETDHYIVDPETRISASPLMISVRQEWNQQ